MELGSQGIGTSKEGEKDELEVAYRVYGVTDSVDGSDFGLSTVVNLATHCRDTWHPLSSKLQPQACILSGH